MRTAQRFRLTETEPLPGARGSFAVTDGALSYLTLTDLITGARGQETRRLRE
jgi:hypothetical protein